jgi:hypothetical protein
VDAVKLVRSSRGAHRGATVIPTSRRLKVMVKRRGTTKLRVTYGTVINPGVTSLGDAPVTVVGDPTRPAAIVLPRTGPPAGSYVTSGPTAELPGGLVAEVTATRSVAGGQQLTLRHVAITEVIPDLVYDGPIHIPPRARSGALGLNADLDIAKSCGLTSGFTLKPNFDWGDPHLETDIRTSPWGGGPKADLLVVSRPRVGIRALTKDGIFCEREIAAPTAIVGFVVIGVPPLAIVIPVYLSIPFKVRLELVGATDARSSITWTAKVGMRTRRVGAALIPMPAFEASDPRLDIDIKTKPKLTVEPSLGVELGLGARGALDINVQAQTGLQFTAQPGSCAWDWKLGTFKAEATIGRLTLGPPDFTPRPPHRLWTGCGGATFESPGAGGGGGDPAGGGGPEGGDPGGGGGATDGADPALRGKILRVSQTGASYLIDASGTRHWIPNGGVYLCRTEWRGVQVVSVTQAQVDAFPAGADDSCTIPEAFNTILRVGATGKAYLVDGGGVRHSIPDGGVYLCLKEWKGYALKDNLTQAAVDAFAVGSAATCTIPEAHNTIVRVAATGKSYFVDGSGVRHWIKDGGVYNCLYYWKGVPAYENLSQGAVDAFPEGGWASCTIPEAYNTIVRVGATGQSYYVDGSGVRHWIKDGGVFNCLYYWKGVPAYWDLSQGAVDSFAEGGWASCTIPEAHNTIVRVGATGQSYYVDGSGVRHWIKDGGVFNCLYYWKGVPAYWDLLQGAVDAFPEGGWAACTIPEAHNSVIRVGATGRAYFVDGNGVRHWIQTGATYNCLVKHYRLYYDLLQGAVDAFPEGGWQPNSSC